MIAVDTNVVTQFLTERDRDQATAAKRIFAGGAIWISRSVLLEAAWVLRSVYLMERANIRDAFLRLIGMRNVHVENKTALFKALALVDGGVDMADAIHLSSRPEGAAFVTFDQAFVKRANRAGVRDIFIA